MTTSENSSNQSLLRDVLYAARHYLSSRTGLVATATIGLGVGAYLNWGWLVAAGLAPIILATAPCAAMCAMGLCMGGRKRKSAEVDGESIAGSLTSKNTDKAAGKTDKGCC